MSNILMNTSNMQCRAGLARGLVLATALAWAGHVGAANDKPVVPLVQQKATEAFWVGDFAALEKMNAAYQQPGPLEANARNRLDYFRTGVGKVFSYVAHSSEAYLSELDALTLQWARDNPQSAYAHILHARSLLAHAQSYRGTSYVKDVPPEAWAYYRRYVDQALAYLKQHIDLVSTDSSGHLLLLEIGRSLSWGQAQIEAIAEAGIARNPDDIELYFMVSFGLLPKWGGNQKVLDTYIRKVTAATSAKFGTGMYARLYADAMDNQFGAALFESSYADWDKMKQGYEDMLARYPDGSARRNSYAYVACIAKDKPTLQRLLGEIGAGFVANSWGVNPQRAFETCTKWAQQT